MRPPPPGTTAAPALPPPKSPPPRRWLRQCPLPLPLPPRPARPRTSRFPPVPEGEKKTVAAPEAQKDQSSFGPSVKEIEVVFVGPKSVNKSVILSNMRTTVGQPYSPAAVEEDVRNLYATGLS